MSYPTGSGPDYILNGIELFQTCGACPEQYDAYQNHEQVGYLRLRHGHFRVDCPFGGGVTVYEANPNGDGVFEYEERDFYLNMATQAILGWLRRQEKETSE